MSNFGIVGWNVYTPNLFVSQQELEEFDGIPAGKYTKGLGQLQVCFDCVFVFVYLRDFATYKTD